MTPPLPAVAVPSETAVRPVPTQPAAFPSCPVCSGPLASNGSHVYCTKSPCEWSQEAQVFTKSLVNEPVALEVPVQTKDLPAQGEKILKREGNKWVLYSRKHPGKVLGRHPSREHALKQERAIEAHKHGKGFEGEHTVRNVAQGINERFSWHEAPILADALEEAGHCHEGDLRCLRSKPANDIDLLDQVNLIRRFARGESVHGFGSGPRRRNEKDMSFLNNNLGGALVAPAQVGGGPLRLPRKLRARNKIKELRAKYKSLSMRVKAGLIRKRDILNRENCYQDGVHVPCPGEPGGTHGPEPGQAPQRPSYEYRPLVRSYAGGSQSPERLSREVTSHQENRRSQELERLAQNIAERWGGEIVRGPIHPEETAQQAVTQANDPNAVQQVVSQLQTEAQQAGDAPSRTELEGAAQAQIIGQTLAQGLAGGPEAEAEEDRKAREGDELVSKLLQGIIQGEQGRKPKPTGRPRKEKPKEEEAEAEDTRPDNAWRRFAEWVVKYGKPIPGVTGMARHIVMAGRAFADNRWAQAMHRHVIPALGKKALGSLGLNKRDQETLAILGSLIGIGATVGSVGWQAFKYFRRANEIQNYKRVLAQYEAAQMRPPPPPGSKIKRPRGRPRKLPGAPKSPYVRRKALEQQEEGAVLSTDTVRHLIEMLMEYAWDQDKLEQCKAFIYLNLGETHGDLEAALELAEEDMGLLAEKEAGSAKKEPMPPVLVKGIGRQFRVSDEESESGVGNYDVTYNREPVSAEQVPWAHTQDENLYGDRGRMEAVADSLNTLHERRYRQYLRSSGLLKRKSSPTPPTLNKL